MNSEMLGTYGFILLVLLLVYWRRSVRSSQARPIRAGGWLMMLPILFVLLGFFASVSSLSATGQAVQYPPLWEELCAVLIGIALGAVMLYHTGYELNADGRVYTKPNANFKYVILAVIVLRLALSRYLQHLQPGQFVFLTMSIAVCYIAVWRIGSFFKYRTAMSPLKNGSIER
ncbi:MULTISPECIES: CcdC protein domain-containing protein [Paenibacillus]|uniref:CcdC protein domain-containing protein n=1 Tax=Paenibacillus TaxID=44249 RepID=UPI0003F90A2C|nr:MULTISPECIES: CcdC protein domain-containing protein [Paenibacillus]CDN41969.1 Uncharacterized protein BN871_AR_00060 [Paenibacillus sp. P22]